MSTSLLSLPAASLLVSMLVTEAALVTSGTEAAEAGAGITGRVGLGTDTERPGKRKIISHSLNLDKAMTT